MTMLSVCTRTNFEDEHEHICSYSTRHCKLKGGIIALVKASSLI